MTTMPERLAELEIEKPIVQSISFRPFLGRENQFVPVLVSHIAGHEIELVLERRWRGDALGWVVVGDDRCGWFYDPIEAMCAVINTALRAARGDDE